LLVDNIGKLLKVATEKLNIFTFASRSTRIPVGGHIHLETPKGMTESTAKNVIRLLAYFYLPLLLDDDLAHLSARFKGEHYGQIEDYRFEERADGIKTIEYRCPSAEWMTTPKTALSTLAYLGTIYAEILKNPKKFAAKYKDMGWRTKEQGRVFQELILADCHKMLKSHFEHIKKAIRTFEYYPEYKKEIEYLFHPNKVLEDKRKVGFDILKGWGLESKEPAKRAVMNQKAIDTSMQEINLEDFEHLIHIQGNAKDINIPLFINEMKKRIISLGWKMKNEYFLFGIKKGVDEFIVFNKAAECLKGHGLAKTEADAIALQQTYRKMNNRFRIEGSLPKNEKERADILRKHILIGVPYGIRQKKDVRLFIEIIHGLETDQFKPSKLELDKTAKVAKCLMDTTIGPEGTAVSPPILSSTLTLPVELTNEDYQEASDVPREPRMQMQIRPVEDTGENGVEFDLEDEDEELDQQHDADDYHEEGDEVLHRREAVEREINF
jgi:hypothetical protein